MPDVNRCKLQLLPLYKENPSLLANDFRGLITKAWGVEHKKSCLEQM